MNNKMQMDYCFECDKDVEYIITPNSGSFRVKDKNIKATIYEAHCAVCGERMIVAEVERKNEHILFEKYKEESGLMTADQIKALRGKYRLSAVAFAKILGLGEKNVTRYENGAIQSDSINRYLKMAEKEDAFWECYLTHRKELTAAECIKSDEAYKAYKEARQKMASDQLNVFFSSKDVCAPRAKTLAGHFKELQKAKAVFDYCSGEIEYVSLEASSNKFLPLLA